MVVIDSDQHLYEPRSMWREHIDPSHRDDALALVDDDLGYTWLSWRGERIEIADVHRPGDVDSCGQHRERFRRGEPASYRYDETLPAAYWDPGARVAWLDDVGLDAAVCFPNYGLLWERRLSADLPALTANLTAWNRWCTSIATDGGGPLHPVGHVTLRDRAWLEAELGRLAASGVRLAMLAPAPVHGRPLSHPDHEPLWRAFVDHGITPVFHVADQPRVFDDCWYAEPEMFVPVIDSTFLWVPPALAITDLILHGVLDRHPDLRIGIVELSSIWVPLFLLMIEGAFDFTTRLNGRSVAPLSLRPSDYFARQVRVSSFSYEDPRRLTAKGGDVFMCCSDFPHSEGTASPIADYERAGCRVDEAPGLFGDNVEFLLRAQYRELMRVGLVAAVLAAAAASTASLVVLVPAEAAAPPAVTVYAHRGGAGLAPENTLGAFRPTHEQFGEQGVWLEMDTQLTADGHLVVIHDDTLDRTTDCSGDVIGHVLAHVETCDASESFPGWPDFEPVPTLRDVLIEGRDSGWRVMVEIKDIIGEANFDLLGTMVADALVALVHEVGFPLDRLLVQSFWPLALDRVEARLPGVATVFLTSSSLPGLPGVGIPVAVNALYSTIRAYEITSPASDSIDMNATIVQVAHLLGRRVVPYTPNTTGEIAQVVAMGVDGVISDFPDRAYDVLGG